MRVGRRYIWFCIWVNAAVGLFNGVIVSWEQLAGGRPLLFNSILIPMNLGYVWLAMWRRPYWDLKPLGGL